MTLKFLIMLMFCFHAIKVKSMHIPDFTDSILSPASIDYDDYMQALYMSTELKEHNDTFMTQFYNLLYDYNFFPSCSCRGCSLNDVCLSCVKKKKCTAINGTYC